MACGGAEALAEIRARAVPHLGGNLAGGGTARQQLGRIFDAHGGKFLHGRAVEPRAERLLQLGPRAAQRRADVVDLQFMRKIFGKIGAGVLDQRVLAAFPPDAGHGALGTAAAAGPQKQQIFQIMWEQSRLGIASIMVSSELEELLEVCQRILIMRDGVIQQEVYPEDVKIDDLYALCMGGEK